MSKLNKFLIFLIVALIIFIIFAVIYLVMQPYIYTVKKQGKLINDKDIYNSLNKVILKKYEVILFENEDNLYQLYSYNNKNKISNFIKSDEYQQIVKYYQEINIIEIEKLTSNIFKVKYNLILNKDSQESIIIKYANNKAIIFDDSIM